MASMAHHVWMCCVLSIQFTRSLELRLPSLLLLVLTAAMHEGHNAGYQPNILLTCDYDACMHARQLLPYSYVV